jgi:D-threo-aldose 1-dehydrogenase
MKRRALGRGPALTEIGLGVAQFGNLYRETTDAEARGAVDAAWERGIRYFDTAPHYGVGLSEERLGAALADRPRDEYALSTKVGRLLVDTPEGADQWDDQGFKVRATRRREWDFSRDGIRRSIDDSLERLGLDRIDIAYLHDPDEHWAEASTTGIDALIELRDEGVIGAIGAGMNQAAMLAEFIRRCDVDVMMVAGRYTLLDRAADEELLPLALERGVGIVAAGVYNSGLLSSPTVPDDAKLDYAPAPAEVIAEARRVAAICERHGATLPDAAVQFALRHPTVVSVVLGTRTAAQAHSGVDRYSVPLGDDLWAAIDERGTR